MNTTAKIREIATIFIESANAGQRFMLSGNPEDRARHEDLFITASEAFKELIDADSSLYDCELREISYAITQGDFNDAKARFSVLAK